MSPTRIDDRRRPQRVAARIREELSSALQKDLSDPRLAGVSLSSVEVTDDLSLATVGIVVLGDNEKAARATTASRVLARLEGGLRKVLASRLGMRRVPKLKFVVDRGRTEVARLDELLKEVGDELSHPRED